MDPRLDQIAQYLLARSDASEFSPTAIEAPLLPHLFILDIVRDPASRAPGLRIRLVGTAIERAFGRSLKGLMLDAIIRGPRGDKVLERFRHCADTREPLWMRPVLQMREGPPRHVEGVAVYLNPERIYGGLIVGEPATDATQEGFEYRSLRI